jgi:hypothetical protein
MATTIERVYAFARILSEDDSVTPPRNSSAYQTHIISSEQTTGDQTFRPFHHLGLADQAFIFAEASSQYFLHGVNAIWRELPPDTYGETFDKTVSFPLVDGNGTPLDQRAKSPNPP